MGVLPEMDQFDDDINGDVDYGSQQKDIRDVRTAKLRSGAASRNSANKFWNPLYDRGFKRMSWKGERYASQESTVVC
jgi:hypothetical protein